MSIGAAPFWLYVGVIAGIYAIYGLGLQLEMGYAGQMNLGHVGTMAVSAYTMAIVVVKLNFPLWLGSLLGIAAAVVFGLVLGLISLRLRSDFFAIAAFALAQIVQYGATNLPSLTGGTAGTPALNGSQGIAVYNLSWLSLQAKVQRWLHSLTGLSISLNASTLVTFWVVTAVLCLLMHAMVRSPWGRMLRAVREDPEGTASLGKHVSAVKVQVLMIGSAIGGVAGLAYAFQFSVFSPSDFDVATVLIAFVVVIVGGLQRVWAIPVGAVLYAVLYAVTRFLDFPPLSYLDSSDLAYLRLIVIGLVLIGFIAFRPQGLFGKAAEANING